MSPFSDPVDPWTTFLLRIAAPVLPARRRLSGRKRIGPVPGGDPLGELFRMRLVWIKPEVVPQLASQIPGELAGLFTPLEST
jgi:hypothetical protein